MRGLILVLFFAILPAARAAAQESDGWEEWSPDVAARLSDAALDHVAEKRREGFTLGAYGLATVAAGAITAGVGHADALWLAFGLTTIAWGAIDALLSLFTLDLGGGAARRAREVRDLSGRALFERRDELVAAHRTSAAIYAVNAGLDIFYIVGGILLYALAAEMDPAELTLEGAGIACASQGVVLLGYDVVNWILSLGRADDLVRAGP